MLKVKKIKGRQIVDSRGVPALEVQLFFDNGVTTYASVPAGASRGIKEAVELRDQDKNVLDGKTLCKAIGKLLSLEKIIIKETFTTVTSFDKLFIELDGTENKSNLGGNVILGLSIAFAKGLALYKNLALYQSLREEFNITKNYTMPTPLFNFINGGVHADNNISIQEFFLIPLGKIKYTEKVFKSLEVFHSLKRLLKENDKSTLVGDEGGFAPSLKNPVGSTDVDEQALIFLKKAVQNANFVVGKDFAFGLDCAGSQLFEDGHYAFFKTLPKNLKFSQLMDIYANWIEKHCVILIEDPFSEEDYNAWKQFTSKFKNKIIIVGDDLYCTNTKYIEKGIKDSLSNAVLIKPNQIGTIYETYLAVKLAKDNNFKTVFSHRSGETEDIWSSHMAVAFDSDYVKFGGLSRSERLAKYNELMRIEEDLATQ